MKILEYENSFGIPKFQEGFLKELAGRTIEEQIRCFAFTELLTLTEVSYKMLEKEIRKESFYLQEINSIPDYFYIIVKDGIIVGVALDKNIFDKQNTQWVVEGYEIILPYQGYVYDSSSDNNGGGYRNRDWYKYLVCLPYDHTLW